MNVVNISNLILTTYHFVNLTSKDSKSIALLLLFEIPQFLNFEKLNSFVINKFIDYLLKISIQYC